LSKQASGKTLRGGPSKAAVSPRLPHPAEPETLLQIFILKVWQRLLSRTDIGIDDDFLEAGGSSQLKRQMILAVEKATRQQIPELTHEEQCTVRKLEAAMLRASSAPTELVSCAKEGHGAPLLFCHGDYATHGLYVSKLTEMLTCDQPVFLLHPYPNPDPKITIEEMGRAYIPKILARHPKGAFRLVGYCNGAQVAWEIAHQLESLGHEVDFVVLIEAISLNARPILRALARLFAYIGAIAPKRVGEKLTRGGMRSIWNGISHRHFSTPYSQALHNYVPPKLRARVICVLSEDSRTKTVFSPKPWSNLALRVDCEYIGGLHRNNLVTLIGEFAPLLNGLLRQPFTSRPM
jgi:hypothetical protein